MRTAPPHASDHVLDSVSGSEQGLVPTAVHAITSPHRLGKCPICYIPNAGRLNQNHMNPSTEPKPSSFELPPRLINPIEKALVKSLEDAINRIPDSVLYYPDFKRDTSGVIGQGPQIFPNQIIAFEDDAFELLDPRAMYWEGDSPSEKYWPTLALFRFLVRPLPFVDSKVWWATALMRRINEKRWEFRLATQKVKYEGPPYVRYYQLNAVFGNRGGHALPDLELP